MVGSSLLIETTAPIASNDCDDPRGLSAIASGSDWLGCATLMRPQLTRGCSLIGAVPCLAASLRACRFPHSPNGAHLDLVPAYRRTGGASPEPSAEAAGHLDLLSRRTSSHCSLCRCPSRRTIDTVRLHSAMDSFRSGHGEPKRPQFVTAGQRTNTRFDCQHSTQQDLIVGAVIQLGHASMLAYLPGPDGADLRSVDNARPCGQLHARSAARSAASVSPSGSNAALAANQRAASSRRPAATSASA